MSTELEVKQQESTQSERPRRSEVYRPSVDIIEENNELTLVAEMPGARPDSIDIQFHEDILTVQAQVEPRQTPQTKYLLREYGVGDFYRTFRVSDQINAEAIRADYHDGMLYIHLPRAEEAKPRKIEVRTAQ